MAGRGDAVSVAPGGAGSSLIGLREVAFQGREAERDALWEELGAVALGTGRASSCCQAPRAAARRGWRAGCAGAPTSWAWRWRCATREETPGAASGLGPMLARFFRCVWPEERAARIAAELGPGDGELVRALAAAMDVRREFADDEGRLILGPSTSATPRWPGAWPCWSPAPVVLVLDDVHCRHAALRGAHAGRARGLAAAAGGTVRTDARHHPDARAASAAGGSPGSARPRADAIRRHRALAGALLPLEATSARALVRRAGGSPLLRRGPAAPLDSHGGAGAVARRLPGPRPRRAAAG
ncbi:MAG: hypothetical protein R3F60_17180 [bacterium]